jgi:hypothetical protein
VRRKGGGGSADWVGGVFPFFFAKRREKAGEGRGDQEAFRLDLEKCGAWWW